MRKTKRTAYQRRQPNVKAASPDRATLTPLESTRITGIGITRTYGLLKSRGMPAIKVGNRFFIPKAALMKWLENAGSEPSTAA
jgi:excisionase family DNA binding protein